MAKITPGNLFVRFPVKAGGTDECLLREFQNDLLAWFIDEANGEETSASNLTGRVLVANLASIYSTTLVCA